MRQTERKCDAKTRDHVPRFFSYSHYVCASLMLPLHDFSSTQCEIFLSTLHTKYFEKFKPVETILYNLKAHLICTLQARYLCQRHRNTHIIRLRQPRHPMTFLLRIFRSRELRLRNPFARLCDALDDRNRKLLCLINCHLKLLFDLPRVRARPRKLGFE